MFLPSWKRIEFLESSFKQAINHVNSFPTIFYVFFSDQENKKQWLQTIEQWELKTTITVQTFVNLPSLVFELVGARGLKWHPQSLTLQKHLSPLRVKKFPIVSKDNTKIFQKLVPTWVIFKPVSRHNPPRPRRQKPPGQKPSTKAPWIHPRQISLLS